MVNQLVAAASKCALPHTEDRSLFQPTEPWHPLFPCTHSLKCRCPPSPSNLFFWHSQVTAPLPAAIWPLSRLSRLSALQLSALSPARGWGPVLARLGPACPLASLCLAFADICDEDIGSLSRALTGLTHLDLNYSR